MKWVFNFIQGLMAAAFLMAGLSKVFASAEQIKMMFTEPLGYGTGFMYTIGAVEVVAGLLLIAGFWKLRLAWAALAFMIVVMIGAVVSSLRAGLATEAAVPGAYLIVLLVLAIASLRKRQATRSTAA